MLQDEPTREPDTPWGWAAGLWLAPEDLFSRDDGFNLKGALGVLNRDGFLSELNRLRDCPQSVSRLRPSLLHHLPHVPVLMNAQLRMYVDEWLDTGVRDDGVEDPRTRDLTKAPNACYAVRAFAGKQRLWLEPASDGLYLRFPSEREGRGIAALGDSAMDQANRLFSLFFLCDWRLRLAKCRRCGDYFELNHWNREYKRGTACGRCARVRSAVFSTSRAREQAETELHRLVARRFGKRIVKSPDWHRDPKLRSAIIGFVNQQIAKRHGLLSVYRHSLTGKWLSWSKNRDGIERAAKGKLHAES